MTSNSRSTLFQQTVKVKRILIQTKFNLIVHALISLSSMVTHIRRLERHPSDCSHDIFDNVIVFVCMEPTIPVLLVRLELLACMVLTV